MRIRPCDQLQETRTICPEEAELISVKGQGLHCVPIITRGDHSLETRGRKRPKDQHYIVTLNWGTFVSRMTTETGDPDLSPMFQRRPSCR